MRVLLGTVTTLVLGAQAVPRTKPVHVLQMKQRSRPIKDEQVQRVEHFRKKTQALKFAVGITEDAFEDATGDDDSPNIETEAYYAYPLTLDYVVDLAFQNGTEMVQLPVIVDTGSSNLAVAVRECTNCDTGATTLELGWYEEDLCIEVVYGSGAWSGQMSDKIKVGFIDGEKKLLDEVYVAGITSSDGFFCGGFYGILGLAYSGLSESYSSCTDDDSTSSGGGGGHSGGHHEGSHHRISSSGHSSSRHSAGSSHGSSSHQQHHGRQHQSHQPSAGNAHQKAAATAPSQPAQAQTPVESRHPLLIVEGNGIIGDVEDAEDKTTVTAPPLLDSFFEDGISGTDMFSILFCGNQASMAIGGVDEDQMTSDLSYVDTKKTYNEMYGYFLVEVASISVGKKTVSSDVSTINQVGGVLVDSGTTLIYFPQSVTSAIETEIMSTLPGISNSFFAWSTCVHESELKNFPSLTISLDGYDLTLSPSEYLLWYGGCYYWGVSASSVSIIGNVALQGRLVVFDKASNKIGFADGDCSPYGGSTFSDDEAMAIHGPVETVDFATQALNFNPPPSLRETELSGAEATLLDSSSSAATSFSGTTAVAIALITVGVALMIEGVRRTRRTHAGYSRVPDEIVI